MEVDSYKFIDAVLKFLLVIFQMPKRIHSCVAIKQSLFCFLHRTKKTPLHVSLVFARQRPGSGIFSYGDAGHGAFPRMFFMLFYENDPYVSQEGTWLFQ
ncbi:hypothetical protein CHH78_17270 [Shouchella clausii]|nr:hypothetical protein CHH76_21435 [Shouchella clausii]PAE79223.1 hypothetical protein CHH78_17270 [Shouchella clausii]PAF03924.1 hypothetical protein CHH66_17780 [Shouchella clausii]